MKNLSKEEYKNNTFIILKIIPSIVLMEYSVKRSLEKRDNSRNLLWSQRFGVYIFAIVIRIIFGLFFIDEDDGPVFLDTGKDILVLNTNIYSETSQQELFNYFPLAYFAILPGLALYYLLDLNNLYLLRLFLKLPLIIGDIVIAILINKNYSKMLQTKYLESQTNKNSSNTSTKPNSRKASMAELFILFNPFIIFTSSVKGQFDVIPVIILYLGWYKFKEEKHFQSGVYIGTAILFKQYSILFSFMLGLNLLKTNYKRFIKFFSGHMAIMIPVLGIASLLNFDGLFEHAILYHIGRPPSGYSVSSIIYYSSTIFTQQNYSSILSVITGNLVEVVFFTSLLFILLYFGYQLWQSENQHIDVLKALLYAFTVFYLFNNVFWEQYFIIFVVIWVEYKCLTAVEITDTSIYWNYAALPLTILFRVTFMTPDDVQNLFGPHAIEIIWITSAIIHFTLMLIFLKQKKPMFARWYIKFVYTTVLIILPFHFLLMTNVDFVRTYFEG